MKYRADVDGLRAVAVLLVLIFHFDLFNLGSAGFIGVDIFFVISGYLISQISWRELNEGRFSFLAFYTRRIRRLAPPLFATQILVIAVAAIVLIPPETTDLAKEVLASQFYVSNIFYWRSISYFGFAGERSFMLHTWSLAVEEQFYLLFPAFLALVHFWKPQKLPIALIGLLIISFAINLALMNVRPEADFYLLPTRAWEFALGALIPYAARLMKRGTEWPALLGGLLLIVLALCLYSPERPFPGWFALMPAAAAALLILSGERPQSPSRKILGNPPMVAIGRISYSLYLVHWPIRVFAGVLLTDYSAPWRWFCFILSFALATVIFFLVEQPARHGWLRRTARPTLTAYAVSLIFIGVLGSSALASGGWKGRFSDEVNRLALVADDRDAISRKCEWQSAGTPLRPCTIGVAGKQPGWLVIGDSHAAALRQAFSLWLIQHNQAGLFSFRSGCLPVPQSGNAGCREFNARIPELLNENRSVRNVVLVSTWRQPIDRGFLDQKGRSVNGKEAISAFLGTLHARLTNLAASGMRIIVWEPVPGAKLTVPNTLARDRALGWDRDIRVTRQDFDKTYQFLLQALDRDNRLISVRIKPADTICGSGYCAITNDGRPLYSDTAHPAFSQAPYYAAIIARNSALPTLNQ